MEALLAFAAAAVSRAEEAEAKLANALARESARDALIAHLKLQIAKLKREQYGASTERTRRLLDQMELQLEELEADASEDALVAEAAARKAASVRSFERRPPVRKPFPEHLPRERVVLAPPCSCPACGGTRLSKLGEDVTETLEVIPRAWKVIQTVREKVACRDCETITQPPAPFHVVPRGWAGPSFLAMLLFEKYGQHQPLNRQADRFAREGVPLSVSTLADQVGAAAFALMPIYRLIEAHILAAERLHGDDTTVPVMAKGKTDTARLWVYVPRRPAVRRSGTAGGVVPLRPRPARRASPRPSRHLVGAPAGRRLCWLQRALPARPAARPRGRSRLLRPRTAQILRARRCRGRGTEEEPWRARGVGLSDCVGGRAEARRSVRDRAHHQRASPGRAPRCPQGT